MATSAVPISSVSGALMAELERLVRKENRSVEEILSEALEVYRNRDSVPHPSQRPDIQRLMEEFRRDRG